MKIFRWEPAWKKFINSTLKFFMIMKLTVCLFLISTQWGFANSSYAELTKLTLNFKNTPLSEVLADIEEQSEFYFLYSKKVIDADRQVDISVTEETVSKILDLLLDKSKETYTILGRQIVLSAKEESTAPSSGNGEMQQRTVTGTVSDQGGQPLPGVSVIIKGTTQGTVSNVDGQYTLTGVPEGTILVFSFVGMRTQEVMSGTLTSINVTMEEESIGIDEVVAIGYGTASKATITGSVGKVEGDKLEIAQTANLSNTLVGRLPGLVTVTSRGVPGSDDPTIRIRGNNTLNNNTPLIVVDGVPGRSMSRLSAQDIESISVLKDASAAIYGSRAANGVILITTKRGKIDRLRTEATFTQGFASPTVLPEQAPSWLYATMMNEWYVANGQNPVYSEDDIQKYKDGSSPYTHPNTDWMNEVFKPVSLETSGNVSFTGGTESLKYFASIGGRYQDAIYRESNCDYSQVNFRSNIDGKITKNLNVSIDIAGRQQNYHFPHAGATDPFRVIPRGKPTQHAYWFGDYSLPGPDVESDQHPGIEVRDVSGWDKSTSYVFQSNLRADFQVPWIEGLSLTGNFSVDKGFTHRKIWEIPYTLYVWDNLTYDENGMPAIVGSTRGRQQAQLNQSENHGQTLMYNILANYQKRISDKHLIKILAGTETILGESSAFEAFRKYFLSPAIPELFAGGDAEKDNTGSSSEDARLNYFGRVNYDFASKYLFEFVWRYDGSYIFPKEGRWGFFPGVSAGWVLTEENFWNKNIGFFDFLKLRASWGQTGNDRVGNFQYLSTYWFGDTWQWYGVEENIFTTAGGTQNKTLYESRIPNPSITWEVANQYDAGLDARILNNKLSIELDYFYHIRSKILIQRNASVPATGGFSLPAENIGEVVNRGFEFTIGYEDQKGDFGYGVSVNGGYAKDKVTFWDEEPGVPEYQKQEGFPMQSQLYYQAIGIFDDWDDVNSYPHWTGAQPGDIIFEDVNEDGKINGLDRKRDYRGTIPRFVGGLNFDFTYKNFYATALFQTALGKIRYHYVESGVSGNYYMADAEGRWTPENTDAEKPRAFSYVGEYWRSNDGRNTYWLRSADYVRLKNAEIGYNMPASVTNKLGMSGLRLFVSGSNLWTFCPGISDFDPESTSTYWDYPLHKVINIGVSVNF